MKLIIIKAKNHKSTAYSQVLDASILVTFLEFISSGAFLFHPARLFFWLFLSSWWRIWNKVLCSNLPGPQKFMLSSAHLFHNASLFFYGSLCHHTCLLSMLYYLIPESKSFWPPNGPIRKNSSQWNKNKDFIILLYNICHINNACSV